MKTGTDIMSPDEARAHALSAKRQLEQLGRDSSAIDPDAAAAAARLEQFRRSQPATVGQIEALIERMEGVEQLLLTIASETDRLNYRLASRAARATC